MTWDRLICTWFNNIIVHITTWLICMNWEYSSSVMSCISHLHCSTSTSSSFLAVVERCWLLLVFPKVYLCLENDWSWWICWYQFRFLDEMGILAENDFFYIFVDCHVVLRLSKAISSLVKPLRWFFKSWKMYLLHVWMSTLKNVWKSLQLELPIPSFLQSFPGLNGKEFCCHFSDFHWYYWHGICW